MNPKIMNVTQKDGRIIPVTLYPSRETSKGSLLVLHGMAEHYERYDHFANQLSSQGYDVYLYSHRGHGMTQSQDELGFFGPVEGYRLVVNDAIDVLNFIRNQDKKLPLYLMGHSMGSLITRNVIQEYPHLNGIIICGTANPLSITTFGGLCMVGLSGYKKHPKKRAPFIDKMMFGSSLYKKLNKRTPFDWLCTDEAEVDNYIKDPYCGFVCTKSFYHDLLVLTNRATNKDRILKTSRSIPILIISGGQDPVGGYGKDIQRLIDFYASHGYNTTSHIYSGLRHEILNEPCKDKIISDIVEFLDDTLSSSAK